MICKYWKSKLTLPPLLHNTQAISYPDLLKFVGLYLDPRLFWLPYIQHIKAKSMRSLNVLKHWSHLSTECSHWRVPQPTIIFFPAHCCYQSSPWSPHFCGATTICVSSISKIIGVDLFVCSWIPGHLLVCFWYILFPWLPYAKTLYNPHRHPVLFSVNH